MRSIKVLALAALIALALTATTRAQQPGVKIFEPTDEWKEIQPDEQVPGGLEYRMDLSAQKKYARNLQRAETTATALATPVATITSTTLQANAGGLVVVEEPSPTVDGASRAARRQDIRAKARRNRQAQANTIISADTAPLVQDAQSPSLTAAVAAGGSSVDYEPSAPPTPTPADGLDERSREMQSVLLGLPQPEEELTAAIAAHLPPEELKALLQRLWDRRQAELKEVFTTTRTEAQLMQETLKQLLLPLSEAEGEAAAADSNGNGTGTTSASGDDAIARRVSLLRDLEFHVATLHNAQDFAAMGGLASVVRLLNATSLDVALHAAWVVGTAVKYAPPIQAAALGEGALPALLALLGRSLDAHEAALVGGGSYRVAVEAPVDAAGSAGVTSSASQSVVYADVPLAAVSKALYALGGLLRSSGQAQRQFIALRGPSAFVRTLNVCAASLRSSDDDSGRDVSADVSSSSSNVIVPSSHPLLRPVRAIAGRLLTLIADLHAEHTAEAQQIRLRRALEEGDSSGQPQPYRDGTARIVLRQRKEETAASDDSARPELHRHVLPPSAEEGGDNNSTSAHGGATTASSSSSSSAPATSVDSATTSSSSSPTPQLLTLVGPAAHPDGGPAHVCTAAHHTVQMFTGTNAPGSSGSGTAGGSGAGGPVSAAVTSAITAAWEVLQAPCTDHHKSQPQQ